MRISEKKKIDLWTEIGAKKQMTIWWMIDGGWVAMDDQGFRDGLETGKHIGGRLRNRWFPMEEKLTE